MNSNTPEIDRTESRDSSDQLSVLPYQPIQQSNSFHWIGGAGFALGHLLTELGTWIVLFYGYGYRRSFGAHHLWQQEDFIVSMGVEGMIAALAGLVVGMAWRARTRSNSQQPGIGWWFGIFVAGACYAIIRWYTYFKVDGGEGLISWLLLLGFPLVVAVVVSRFGLSSIREKET